MARDRVFRSDRLLKILEATDMNQDEFAAFLGMDQAQFNRYINEAAEPTAALVVRMATRLDITTDYLLGLSDEPNIELKTVELSGDEKEFSELVEKKGIKRSIDDLSKHSK